jgi:hypothetical protein
MNVFTWLLLIVVALLMMYSIYHFVKQAKHHFSFDQSNTVDAHALALIGYIVSNPDHGITLSILVHRIPTSVEYTGVMLHYLKKDFKSVYWIEHTTDNLNLISLIASLIDTRLIVEDVSSYETFLPLRAFILSYITAHGLEDYPNAVEKAMRSHGIIPVPNN